MSKSLLLLLLLAVAAPTRACQEPLEDDPDTPDATPRQVTGGASTPAPVTGGGEPGTPGPLSAEVPAAWREQASALGTAEGADAAVAAFVKAGAEACPVLRSVVLDDADLSRRGRAIQALAGIPDPCAEDALLELHRVRTLPALVRTWAAAGRVQRVGTVDDLVALAPLVSEFPALQRPVGMKAESLLDADVSAGHLVALSIDAPALSGSVLPLLRKRPTAEVVAVMLEDGRDPIRRQAAAYVGSLVAEDPSRAADVIAAYRFTGGPSVRWKGGALYVPGARWDKDQARALFRNLLSWQIFCEVEGLDGEKRQIGNNLRSVGIWRVAGYQRYQPDTFAAVAAYGQDEGKDALRSLLKEHGLENDPRWIGRPQVTR